MTNVVEGGELADHLLLEVSNRLVEKEIVIFCIGAGEIERWVEHTAQLSNQLLGCCRLFVIDLLIGAPKHLLEQSELGSGVVVD